MYRSVLTSWRMSSMGKSGARASGPIGSRVPGWSGGGSGYRKVGADVVVVRRELGFAEQEPALAVLGTSRWTS